MTRAAPKASTSISDLESRPKRLPLVKTDVSAVKAFIEVHAPGH